MIAYATIVSLRRINTTVMQNSFEIDKTILPWLGRTMKALDFYIADEFTSHGLSLTKAQIILLRKLTMNDGIPQNNLAFITDRDKTSLTRLIHTMEKKELVWRKTDEHDKRINLVFITQKGKQTLEDAFPILKDVNEKITDGISVETINTTIETLKQIIKNTDAEFLSATLTQSKQ